MASLLDLVIRNKLGIIYNDKVEAVSSKNDKGIFDILPEHENFISVIKEMKIENGILRAYKNRVNIYIGI